jgi:hypothetical protein
VLIIIIDAFHASRSRLAEWPRTRSRLPTARELIKTTQRVGRAVLGKQMAGAGVTVFPDDVFLVSYPRSGNTWARFLIGNLLNPNDPCTFVNVEERVPEIYFNPDWKLRRMPRPRLLKSHQAFDPRYPRVIYVIRDPRDVAVSTYHHNIKTRNVPDGFPMDDFIPRFIAGDYEVQFGSWRDNVLSWLTLRQDQPNFLLLRYEKMKREPEAELLKVARFLKGARFDGIDESRETLSQAVELSSADRMRQLEKQEGGQWVTTKWTRQDKPFIRTAGEGGWKKSLSAASVERIEAAWGTLMGELGYEVTAGKSVVRSP